MVEMTEGMKNFILKALANYVGRTSNDVEVSVMFKSAQWVEQQFAKKTWTPELDWSLCPELCNCHIFDSRGVGLWTEDPVLTFDKNDGWTWKVKRFGGRSGLLLPLGLDHRVMSTMKPEVPGGQTN